MYCTTILRKRKKGTSLAVQWLRICASTAGGTGSVPGWGTKIPHAARCGQKKERNIKIKGEGTGRATWPAALLKGRTLKPLGGHEGQGAVGTRGVTAPPRPRQGEHLGPGHPKPHMSQPEACVPGCLSCCTSGSPGFCLQLPPSLHVTHLFVNLFRKRRPCGPSGPSGGQAG